MNILFVRLSYIGDILHATPAARWIKEQYPDAKLHWIVTPSMVELLDGNPYVDEIIPWERDEYEAHSKKLHIPTMWRIMCGRCRRRPKSRCFLTARFKPPNESAGCFERIFKSSLHFFMADVFYCTRFKPSA